MFAWTRPGVTMMAAISLTFFASCATTPTKTKSSVQKKPGKVVVSSYTQPTQAVKATPQAPKQDLSLPPVKPIEPKKVFLANDLEGRSGAFRNLITVFQTEATRQPAMLTVVYDGKAKGPTPTSSRRTSHVRIDVSSACPGSKALRPVKLKQLWNVYHSPGKAQFHLPVQKMSRCDDSKMVRIETMGLRCQNINLQTCLRLDVHEVLEVPLKELTNLEVLRKDELPGQAKPEDKVLEAAVR